MVAFDVIEDILLRSDAKDLLQCKSVCKSWYSLISTPLFAKAHLKKLAACNNNNDIRIAMPTYWKTVKLPNESLYKLNVWRVVGSSNGLLCVSCIIDNGVMLVNNPLTREVTTLPMAPMYPKAAKSLCLSFGYDASSDDYKVVMGIKENRSETFIQVLSLKSNTWKTIGRFNYTFFHNKSGIMFNGSFYWIAFDCTLNSNNINPWEDRKQVILSFDLSREVFTIIPQPNDPRCSWYEISLGITENQQLCVYFPSNNHDLSHDIWVLRSHDVEHSWKRLPNDCEMTYKDIHFMNKLEFSTPNKNHERINFVCPDNKCLPRPWKKYVSDHILTPSLVSPFVNSRRPSHPANSKMFINSWSIEVAKAVCPYTQKEIGNFFKDCEKTKEFYKQEVGEAQNLYLHEDGET